MKKIIVFILLIIFLLPCTSVAYADTSETVNEESPYMVTVTRGQIYDVSGRIYVGVHYLFDLDKTYEYELDGESKTLTYDDIILKIREMYNGKQEVIYDESTPNEIVVVQKAYNSRWEMNHDLGITGDEIDEPLEREEGFWYTTYINRLQSYLANDGAKILETNYKILGLALFGITNVDMSLFKFNFCYGTEYESIYSNATRVVHVGDMYYHLFEGIDENTEIILYQKAPNTPNWEGVIIGSSLGVILIGIVIFLFVRKRRKNG